MNNNGNFSCHIFDLQDIRWTAFVQNHPDSIALHHPAWSELINDWYGYRTFVAVVIDNQDEICAGITMVDVNSPLTGCRWTSLPFIDFCPPLYTNPLELEALIDFFLQRYQNKEVPRIEIRWPMTSKLDVKLLFNYVIHNRLHCKKVYRLHCKKVYRDSQKWKLLI